MKQSQETGPKLMISKRLLRGDDSHKVFSIRIPESTVAQLDAIAQQSNRSRNEVVNLLLDFALAHCTIVEE